ncbi:hypothetical protein EAF00_011729 [Botryotinia globosa]|nr:hypothetical protein EAF00_011729 [Botryotinia globosa]
MNTAAEQSNAQPSEERNDSEVDTDDLETEESALLVVGKSADGSVIIPHKIGNDHTRSVILVHDIFDTAASWANEFVAARLNDETIMSMFPGTTWCFPEVVYPWLKEGMESHRSSTSVEMVDFWTVYSNTVQSERRLEILASLYGMLQPVQQMVDRESKAVGIQNVFIGGLEDGATATMQLFLASLGNQGGAMGGFIGMNGVLPFHWDIFSMIDETPNFEDLSQDEFIDKQIHDLRKVVAFMRDTLALPPEKTIDRTFACLGIPIFLGSMMTDPDDLERRDDREDMIEILRHFRCFHPIYFTNDFRSPDLAGQVEGFVNYLRKTDPVRVPG